MKTSELDYELPQELIAQRPAERRDQSRLLVWARGGGEPRHRVFRDLPDELPGGTLVVVNDTRVVPARIRLEEPRGEVLLLEPVGGGEWEALARPARGRAGGRGAASPVHHGAARRPRALPDGVRARAGVGGSADRRPPLHAGGAGTARRGAGDAPRRPRHLPAARCGDPRGASAARRAVRGGGGGVAADRG